MTVHQCPKCELRFNWKTELDDHCWHDHPQFRHEYPAVAQPAAAAHPVAAAGAVDQVPVAPGKGQHRLHASSLIEWLVPGKPAESQHHDGA